MAAQKQAEGGHAALGSERSKWKASSGGQGGYPTFVSCDTAPEEARLLLYNNMCSAQQEREARDDCDTAYQSFHSGFSNHDVRSAASTGTPLVRFAPLVERVLSGGWSSDAQQRQHISANQQVFPTPSAPQQQTPDRAPASAFGGSPSFQARSMMSDNIFGHSAVQQSNLPLGMPVSQQSSPSLVFGVSHQQKQQQAPQQTQQAATKVASNSEDGAATPSSKYHFRLGQIPEIPPGAG